MLLSAAIACLFIGYMIHGDSGSRFYYVASDFWSLQQFNCYFHTSYYLCFLCHSLFYCRHKMLFSVLGFKNQHQTLNHYPSPSANTDADLMLVWTDNLLSSYINSFMCLLICVYTDVACYFLHTLFIYNRTDITILLDDPGVFHYPQQILISRYFNGTGHLV